MLVIIQNITRWNKN